MDISTDRDFRALGESFLAFKIPAWFPCEIATSEHVIETNEGPQTVVPGSLILTGLRGERWPVAPDNLDRYEIKEESGQHYVSTRPSLVEVVWSPSYLDVYAGSPAAPLQAKIGDKIIRYVPDHFGVVSEHIFEAMYMPLSQAILDAAVDRDPKAQEYLQLLCQNPKAKSRVEKAFDDLHTSSMHGNITQDLNRAREGLDLQPFNVVSATLHKYGTRETGTIGVTTEHGFLEVSNTDYRYWYDNGKVIEGKNGLHDPEAQREFLREVRGVDPILAHVFDTMEHPHGLAPSR